eukprot:5145290-Pleurochrysis_carterae.AAC.1
MQPVLLLVVAVALDVDGRRPEQLPLVEPLNPEDGAVAFVRRDELDRERVHASRSESFCTERSIRCAQSHAVRRHECRHPYVAHLRMQTSRPPCAERIRRPKWIARVHCVLGSLWVATFRCPSSGCKDTTTEQCSRQSIFKTQCVLFALPI